LDELEISKTTRGPPIGDLVRTEAPRPRRAPSNSGGHRLPRAHGFTAVVSRPLFLQLASPPSTALRGYRGCTPDSSFPRFASIISAPPSSLPLPSLLSSTASVPALSGHFPAQPTHPRALVQRSSPTQPPLASTTGPCFHRQFTSARTTAAIESFVQ
jgi:hypothetical protein